ncbi:MAG: leucine-rich repeat domain-containing protein [Oscillospiraceae bacterium]|nr:leucine-rich repeat domain-containing protein [Oscillospiraceae bacterium]
MSIQWNITRKGRVTGCSDPESRNLVIPDGVKEIGDHAFRHYRWMESIVIPESVERIGGEAFVDCRNLREIIIPESVNYIGHDAFAGTPWLENYPDDFVIINQILVKYRGTDAEVRIPEQVTVIGNSAMKEYRNLRKVIFPEHLTEIKRRAFRSCENLTDLYFPDSLKLIGYEAFKSCTELRNIRLPSVMDGISFEAFAECPYLERVPMFVSHEKIFFTFPDKNIGYAWPSAFVDLKVYEDMEMLLPEIRYDLMFQIYVHHLDEEGSAEYIGRHFPEMVPVLIRLHDENLIQKLNLQFPELFQKHIDKLIMEANRQKRHDLQIRFMHDKYQYGDSSQSNLYL